MSVDRHVKHRPTKEEFYDVMAATAFAQAINGHYGADIDDNGDFGAIQAYIPHDFALLEELVLRVIPNLAVATMTFTVMNSYGRKDELPTTGGNLIAYSFGPTGAGVNNATLQEIDIGLSVANGRRSLRAKDQLGITVYRAVGQNTDFFLLGARIKYKYQ